MTCHEIMDKVYEYDGEPMPLLLHVRIALHLFVCPGCARELERFETVRDILKTGFFPPTPDFEETVMEKLRNEAPFEISAGEEAAYFSGTEAGPPAGLPDTGVSFRRWVITGFIALFSLSTSFFGLNFSRLAASEGISFLLPVGITVGVVLTCYGALFIGSHVKELSERFGLH
ncbi:MAG: peptidoglycan-binding protein [Treponema sp.]|jgi:hypothetical protein|nr:peptidoglycan-binding protein [Treponema sp.]